MFQWKKKDHKMQIEFANQLTETDVVERAHKHRRMCCVRFVVELLRLIYTGGVLGGKEKC